MRLELAAMTRRLLTPRLATGARSDQISREAVLFGD
jgi:hypothetical protein